MRLTEEEIRRITLSAIEELGENATPQKVKKIVEESLSKIEHNVPVDKTSHTTGRVILTSFGLNNTGIVAAITKALSEAECDIQDISQKLMGEFFTMIMLVDITQSSYSLKELQEKMNEISDELKIKIFLQHEDLFRQMHRI
ncbi:MAG: ACT domain-containing protein [Melioribacteraceae bacterium]|nr:ACT domain-containing protein [Melioribacteraceae bacterium]